MLYLPCYVFNTFSSDALEHNSLVVWSVGLAWLYLMFGPVSIFPTCSAIIKAKLILYLYYVFVRHSYLCLHLYYICGAVGIVFIMLTNRGSWAKPVCLR